MDEIRKINRALLPDIYFDGSEKRYQYNGLQSPLEQALQNIEGGLYLVASGGIGKTTSLRSFWLDFLQGRHNIPCLYVDLRLLNGMEKTPILSYIQRRETYHLEELQLREGAVNPILLLDGANETPAALREGAQCKFVKECHSLIADGWRIVISSRSDRIGTEAQEREFHNLQYGSFAELTDEQVNIGLNSDIDLSFFRLLHNNMMLSIYKDLKSYGINLPLDKLTAGILLKYYVDICLKVRYVKNCIGGDESEREIYELIKQPKISRRLSRWLDDFTIISDALMDDPLNLGAIPFEDKELNASLQNIALVVSKREEGTHDQYVWANELYQSYFEARLLIKQLKEKQLDRYFLLPPEHKPFAQKNSQHYYDVFKFAGDLLTDEFAQEGSDQTASRSIKEWLNELFAAETGSEEYRNALTVLSVLSGNGFPDGIQFIGKDAFCECSYLETITIPKTVKQIGERAFFLCENLKKFDYEEGCALETIGWMPFSGCGKLESLALPNCVIDFCAMSIDGCENLIHLETPDMVVRGKGIMLFDDNGFRDFPKLEFNEYKNGLYLGNRRNPYVIFVGVKDEDIVSCDIHEDTKCIDSQAFSRCGLLERVCIPEGVTRIGGYAFAHCVRLAELIFPTTLICIGAGAFGGCSSLQTIEVHEGNPQFYSQRNCLIERDTNRLLLGCNNSIIPKSVADIDGALICGTPVFDKDYDYGNDLERIEVEEGNPKYYSQGNCLIERVSKRLILCCKNSIIPNDILEIDERAIKAGGKFKYSEYENGEYFGSEENPYLIFVKVKDPALSYCAVNAQTRLILDRAFSECKQLSILLIPDNGLVFAEEDVWGRIVEYFRDCVGLKYNEYRNGLYLGDDDNPYSMFCRVKDRDVSFFEINERTKLILPGAFHKCLKIEGVVIPEGVTHILGDAFCGCIHLKALSLPNSIIKIGKDAFGSCKELREIIIPESVRSVGERAFGNCKNLINVIILSKEIILREGVFAECTSLTDIYCVAEFKPLIWDKYWFAGLFCYGKAKVHWGYKKS